MPVVFVFEISLDSFMYLESPIKVGQISSFPKTIKHAKSLLDLHSTVSRYECNFTQYGKAAELWTKVFKAFFFSMCS